MPVSFIRSELIIGMLYVHGFCTFRHASDVHFAVKLDMDRSLTVGALGIDGECELFIL